MQNNYLRLNAALITAFLILLGLFHHEPINPDGILYLETAHTFLNS